MNQAKYIGMDVHKETISIAVMNAAGKLVMECIIETKAATMARLSLARKIASITLILWKKGVGFDAQQIRVQAA
jgi:hypothetical protein